MEKKSSRMSIASKGGRPGSRRKTIAAFHVQDEFPAEKRDHIKLVMDKLLKLLEENNCDDLVGFEVEDAVHPFHTPVLPLVVESEESSRRKALYKYVRDTQKQIEKIRLHLMNIKTNDEIEGLFVSGTLTGYPLFKVVVELFTSISTLKVLRLVNCSLKKEGIAILGEELGRTAITHLYLDRNKVPDQNYHCILKNNKILQHLSLVQCHIDEKGTRLLGRMLGPQENEEPSHYLKYLNINNNRIDCFAAKHLAQGLKWNRDLIFLSLAGNRIGNAGMEFISKTMQETVLEKWEKELKEKRLEKRTEQGKEMIDRLLLSEEINEMEEEYGIHGMDEGEECSYEGDIYRKHKERERLLEKFIRSDPNPLSRDVIYVGDKYVTKGNKTLRSINISYNKIEEAGFSHLLNTLRYQNTERQAMKAEDKMNYHLINLNLTGNFCPENSRVLKKIKYYLRKFVTKEDEPKIEAEIEEGDEEVVDEVPETEGGEEMELETEEQTYVRETEVVEKRGKKKIVYKSHDDSKIEDVCSVDFEYLLTVPQDLTPSDTFESDPPDSVPKKSLSPDNGSNNSNIINASDSWE